MNAHPASEFIISSRYLVSKILGENFLETMIAYLWAKWLKLKSWTSRQRYFSCFEIKEMAEVSTRIMRKFLVSFVTITPHSKATERAASHNNNMKSVKRAPIKQEKINGIMHHSLNGKITAYI